MPITDNIKSNTTKIEQLAQRVVQLNARLDYIDEQARKAKARNAKPWYTSKGIMGPLSSIALKVLALVLWKMGFDPVIITAALGSSAVGDAVGAVGRATAKGGVK